MKAQRKMNGGVAHETKTRECASWKTPPKPALTRPFLKANSLPLLAANHFKNFLFRNNQSGTSFIEKGEILRGLPLPTNFSSLFPSFLLFFGLGG